MQPGGGSQVPVPPPASLRRFLPARGSFSGSSGRAGSRPPSQDGQQAPETHTSPPKQYVSPYGPAGAANRPTSQNDQQQAKPTPTKPYVSPYAPTGTASQPTLPDGQPPAGQTLTNQYVSPYKPVRGASRTASRGRKPQIRPKPKPKATSQTVSSDQPILAARQPPLQIEQLHAGQGPMAQFVSPQDIFQPPPTILAGPDFEQSQAPFTGESYQEPLGNTFLTGGRVVHEGFIPAPGREDVDALFPDLVEPFGNEPDSADEGDSEFERRLAETANRDDSEKDKDYSTEEEVEVDPDEILIEEEFVDEEDEPVPKRGKLKTRGTRGGARRGRPSVRGRGTFQGRGDPGGNTTQRKRKPGKRGRPKGKFGPRPAADPGPQFKELQRLANDAYAREDYQEAATYALQAIALNPEIYTAHSLLSTIYSTMGRDDQSVQALIVGANTKRDAETWWQALDRIDQINEVEYPQFTKKYKQTLKLGCLNSLIELDGNDYEARSRKLDLDADRGPGRITACVRQCLKLLALRPHQYDILHRMATLGTTTPKARKLHLARIIRSFDETIDYFLAHEKPPTTPSDIDRYWSLLNVYLDLLDHACEWDRALLRLRTLSRWVQGRQRETYWDNYDDDREFDVEDVPRRTIVPEFVRKSSKANYGKAFPMEMRVKLGIYRLRKTSPDDGEAMMHLEMLEPNNEGPDTLLFDYADLFCLVADTLHDTGHDRDALRFYEPVLRHVKIMLALKSLLGLHTAYTNMGEHTKADEIIPTLLEWNASMEDLAILAKFFEDQGMHEEAWKRAEVVFGNRCSWRLRKVQYGAYDKMLLHYKDVRKKARGKHKIRKERAKKYRKKVRVATNAERDDSENDDHPGERPSLGPMGERPKKGLFRAKGRMPTKKPRTFLPPPLSSLRPLLPKPAPDSQTAREAEPEELGKAIIPTIEGPDVEAPDGGTDEESPQTLEGTDVPVDAIARKFFREKMTKLAAEHADELNAARAQHREVVASFERLEDLRDDADDGDGHATAEYLSIARELVEEFSTFDLFYSDRKQEFRGYFRRITSGDIWTEAAIMALAVEANRIEDGEKERELKELPDEVDQDFYGVHFDQWLDLFGRYALLLGRNGEQDRCFSVIDVALQSNIFWKNDDYHQQIEMCRLVCALAVDNSSQAADAVRYLLKANPFSTELFRIFSAANRLCSVSEGYANGKTIKVLMRYTKTMDYVLLKPEQRVWYNFAGDDRTQWMQHAVSTDFIKHVKDHDPALFALYGHVLMCGGSYMGALNYFFRAFAVTPEDPVVNLSIGISYIQHAMKRLAENRQFQIEQGLSFINRYYEIRTNDDVALHRSEAEYNVGRIWHGLGLMTQALTAYQRCIALSERIKQEAVQSGDDGATAVEDFATEAAFGIQAICVLSGDFERACSITDSALVIE